MTAKRDTATAKRFLLNAIEASGNAMPRVMNVDKNAAYPAAVEELKPAGMRVPCRGGFGCASVESRCDAVV
jgi:transposase-like protein